MGLPFVNKYPPSSKYYLCRACRTHIALQQERYSCIIMDEMIFSIVRNPVNLVFDWDEFDENSLYVDAHCAGCMTHLGGKFIEGGEVGLFLNKLLFWNGNHFLDADTMDPIGQPSKSSDKN